ncbi:MAG: chalcone isomerase family protein [Proteobacteria bacterium]|nr:chalcone isomerase family protein [Pseudomonadota bacterium]
MSQFHRFAGAALLAALLASPGLYAAEVAGVKIEERARVGNSELVLNGAGLRSKLFIKLYVGALYVSQKSGTAAALIDATAPRRMSLRLLRDISADTLHSALEEGLAHNNTPAELEAVKPQSEQFGSLMRGLGKVHEGDSVALDFSGDGVALSVNGELRGKVAGGAFAKALLKVWLGDKPADTGLKKALLGN